jgi:hypothetical protein
MTDILEQRIQASFHAARLPGAPLDLRLALQSLPEGRPIRRRGGHLQTLAFSAALGAMVLAGLGLAVGSAIRDSFTSQPDRGLFDPTPGWLELADLGGDALVSPAGGGVVVTTPREATLLGVAILCEGLGTAVATVGDVTGDTVQCATPAAEGRTEFAIAGGQQVDVIVRVEDATLVRFQVEANALRTYPSAPPLPADVAETPYAAAGLDKVALGTLGDNTETIIDVAGTPGVPGDGVIPIAVQGSVGEGERLELYEVADGTFIRTLAAVSAPAFIYGSWVDATNDQVFYQVVTAFPASVEFHRVGLDGSDDRIVATDPSPNGSRQATLALDDSVFVVESCGLLGSCERIVVDAATLDAQTYPGPAGDVCELVGVSDGYVVERAGPSCDPSAPVPSGDPGAPAPITIRPLVSAFDGTGERALADGDRVGRLIRGETGPRLVAVTAGDAEDPSIEVIDVVTGETRILPSTPEEDLGRSVWLQDVRLPPDWVLFGSGLGDLPGLQNQVREPPLLINVVTDERIELVNLPHFQS